MGLRVVMRLQTDLIETYENTALIYVYSNGINFYYFSCLMMKSNIGNLMLCKKYLEQ